MDDKYILQYLPLNLLQIQNKHGKNYRISEEGIHHHSCPGIIIESSNGIYNDKCSIFIKDPYINVPGGREQPGLPGLMFLVLYMYLEVL